MNLEHENESNTGARRAAQPGWYLWWMLVAVVMVWQARISYHPEKLTDFNAFYGAGKLALAGENIYDFKASGVSRRPYLYPPTFAVAPMMLLALLPYKAAMIVFIIINQLLLLGTFWLLRDALWRLAVFPLSTQHSALFKRWLLHPDTGVLIAWAVCFRYVHSNVRHGNANMYVTFFLTLALWLAIQQRKPLLYLFSGASIALATAIKVTPGLFGLYLAWSWIAAFVADIVDSKGRRDQTSPSLIGRSARRATGMLGGALGLVFFLLLVPAMAMGFSKTLDRLHEYKAHMEAATSGDDAEDDPIGHPGGFEQKQLEGGNSIQGTLMHYLTHRPMRFVFKNKTERLYFVNIVDMPEDDARRIAKICGYVLLAATILLTSRTIARNDFGGMALSWGLMAVAMVLISPLTRDAHCCVLLITAMAVIALIQQGRIVGPARGFCMAAWGALCLEGIMFSPGVIGELNNALMRVRGVGFWTLLAVYASTAWALWKLKPVPAETANGERQTATDL